MSVKEGDVIQITEPSHPWYPALLIVDEVKTWGVQAGCIGIVSNSNADAASTSTAYNRLKNGDFEVVGSAILVPE